MNAQNLRRVCIFNISLQLLSHVHVIKIKHESLKLVDQNMPCLVIDNRHCVLSEFCFLMGVFV